MLTQRKLSKILYKVTNVNNTIGSKGCFLLASTFDPLLSIQNYNYDVQYISWLYTLMTTRHDYYINLTDHNDFNYDLIKTIKRKHNPESGIVIRLTKYTGKTHFIRVYQDAIYDPARGLIKGISVTKYIIEYNDSIFTSYQIRDIEGFNNIKFKNKEFKDMRLKKFENYYQTSIDRIIDLEGGYVNHPSDPGKETYLGISRKYNPDYSGWPIIDSLKVRGIPVIGVTHAKQLKDLALKEVYPRYRNFESYIQNQECDMDMYATLLAFSINAGNSHAIEVAKNNKDLNSCVDTIVRYYRDLLKRNPKLEVFRKGWSKRISMFCRREIQL